MTTKAATLAFLLAFTACKTPQEAVIEAGGTAPVRCYKQGSFDVCRDVVQGFWICAGGDDSSCINVREPAAVFAARLPVSGL